MTKKTPMLRIADPFWIPLTKDHFLRKAFPCHDAILLILIPQNDRT